jgi:carboxyl-terminal processing protease
MKPWHGLRHKPWCALACAAALALTACGGSDSADNAAAASCDLAGRQTWLRAYMADWYYWSGASPDPAPAGYASVEAYYDALKYTGSAGVPADRWSYLSDSASYNQFFAEGRTLGYGLFVNGIELRLPLRVRLTEPLSPAAAAGLVRGDSIVSINGRSAAELVAANDFSALSPSKEGDTLALVIDSGSGPRSVVLSAATYTLTPVPVNRVLTLSNGRRAGYLMMKDFITQAEAPLASALAGFTAAGASELILDLRYNGGGRISTATVLASLIGGAGRHGEVFARLEYNGRHPGSRTDFTLKDLLTPAFTRVVVLTGPRSCSASELVVNGLKPFVPVVTIGGTSCGKPFGFNPAESCGSTFSAVNFESFNALGQGRYYNGIEADCAVSEDFTGALGEPGEKLTAAALAYLQSGSCVAATATERALGATLARRSRLQGGEPGERHGMSAE